MSSKRTSKPLSPERISELVTDLLDSGYPAALPPEASYRSHGWLKQQRNSLKRIVRDSFPAGFEDFKVDVKPDYETQEWVANVAAARHWTSVSGLTTEGATLMTVVEQWLNLWPGVERNWHESAVPIPGDVIPDDERSLLWTLSTDFLTHFNAPSTYWESKERFYLPCIHNNLTLETVIHIPIMGKEFNAPAAVLAQRLKLHSGDTSGDSE